MKKFLIILSVFVVIPLSIAIILEVPMFLLKSKMFNEIYLEKAYSNVGNEYKWIEKVKPNHKVIIAGSSSVRYGLSCSILNKLSNDSLSFVSLAMDARDPIETFFILKQINLNDVKTVYFGLDPWIYTKSYYQYRNSYLSLDLSFIPAMKYIAENKNITTRYKQFFKFLFPKQNNQNMHNQIIPIDFGSVKLEGSPLNFEKPVDEWFQIDKYGWSNLQFVYLSKIDSLCKSKNIEFVAFIPPKRSDYSIIYKSKCRIIHQEFVNKLIGVKFSAPIFGTFDQLNSVGDFDLFREAYHLNPYGQEVYSKIFYEMTLEKRVEFSSNYKWFKN